MKPNASDPSPRRVRIVGAGVAGLSAAIAHAEEGWHVEIFEAREQLGGRAWSRNGIENGTHVILACYDSFRRLLRAIDRETSFFAPEHMSLAWLDEDAQLHTLRARRLPGPLGLLAGILGCSTLDFRTRMALVRAGRVTLTRRAQDGESVSTWLARLRVGPRARAILFEPLCRAIMNLEADHACAQLFAETLRIAFAGGARGAAIWVPATPWGEILDRGAREALEGRGVIVRNKTRVAAIEAGERAPRIALRSGERFDDHERVVLAVPPHVAHTMLPEADRHVLGSAGEIRSVPIVNLHVRLPRDVLPSEAPVLAFENGQPFHFLCRRPRADGSLDRELPACMIAGAAHPLDGLESREIAALGLAQLARFIGRRAPWPSEMLESAHVIRESHATLRAAPGVNAGRPAPGPTALPGLSLAGDWTAVGLPSTLEAAARSGFASIDGRGDSERAHQR